MAKVMTELMDELLGALHSCLNYKISNRMTAMKVQVTDGLYSIVLLCFTGLLFFVSELICFLKLSTRATCFPILLIITYFYVRLVLIHFTIICQSWSLS